MVLISFLDKLIKSMTCRHRATVIEKFDADGKRLPLDQHHYSCLNCGKLLEPLTYMHVEKR